MAHEFIYTCHKLSRVHPPDKTVLENISLSFYPGAKIDLPAPFAPSTPIFAPGRNESVMPSRIVRSPMTFRRSFMV